MARSQYIYVVQDSSGDLLAAFTVKHELAGWTARDNGLIRVTRLRDGRWGGDRAPVELNPATLDPAV